MIQAMYRGRDALGEWVYGSLVSGYCDDGKPAAYIATGLPVGTSDFMNFSVPLHIVLPYTVGRWTGWTDVGGEPVYAGDIVEMMVGERPVRFEVRDGEDDQLLSATCRLVRDSDVVRVRGWFFVCDKRWYLPSVYSGGRCDTDGMRVVGNVYEKSLLTTKEIRL